MDASRRQITKIAREVSKFTTRMLKTDGVGPAEYDFIHVVRKHPGISQAGIRSILTLDKGACARRTASLESKGFLRREADPADGRSQRLYATAEAEQLKRSKASVEALYYAYLLEGLSAAEADQFCQLLNQLYLRSKAESKADFPELTHRFQTGEASL
ncbi:MarR family transcriptional regulator [Oscillospiraceae bacterium HV4-5-C5C]|nr:MarR family transcriptional regulator [Oscillospiraceae bacterium HV4-5-C5C]